MGNKRGRKGKKKKRFPKQETKPFQRKIFPFPFLEHNVTIDSIKKQFHIMFIMRGLPGSGKSTLIKEIIKIYPNAVICSNDHYLMENDQYIWSSERCYYGHRYSKKLATKCCEMNCPILIIDNTNITEIETEVYFQIALKHSYVTVLVTPQTPWSFDPIELSKRGQHNVSLEALKIKLKHFQDILPVFYAWVVGQQDAEVLKTLAIHHFQECLKYVPQLGAEISKIHPEELNPADKQKGLYTFFMIHCIDQICIIYSKFPVHKFYVFLLG